MKLRLSLIVLALILAGCALAGCAVAARAASGPPVALTSVVNSLVAATNTGSPTRVSSYFTSNATVVDEVAPYMWTGPGAGARWWQAVMAQSRAQHMQNMRASAQTIKYWNVTGNSAWVSVPLTVSSTMNGRPVREIGIWVLTLTRSGGSWLVSSASWGTSAHA